MQFVKAGQYVINLANVTHIIKGEHDVLFIYLNLMEEKSQQRYITVPMAQAGELIQAIGDRL